MKTVMKRLFSLMLVAVLLVSAVPTAFAAMACPEGHTNINHVRQVTAAACGVNQKDLYRCNECEGNPEFEIEHQGTALEHEPSANAATCENGIYCLKCHATIENSLGHAAAPTWINNTDKHWQVCSRCNTNVNEANHDYTTASCTTAATCRICGYVSGTSMGHDYADATCTAPKTCKRCSATEGEALGHDWAAATCGAAKTCKRCPATDGNALGHNWIEDNTKYKAPTCTEAGEKVYICPHANCPIKEYKETISALGHNIGSEGKCLRDGCSHNETTRYAVEFYKDYNEHNDPVTKLVAKGTKVYSIYTPYRDGYSFEGWYTVSGSRVSESATVTGDSAYFAKWTQNAPHEVYVKFYTHGNTKNVVKYVDMHHYAHDGVISLDDLMIVAKKNFKARGNDSLYIQGPFTSSEWDIFCDNSAYRNTREKIEVSQTSTTVIHAMVRNVDDSKASSSSKADSSNPKTGDMIFAPVAVMGLSVSALAVLFYLNKKRAY